MDVKAEAKALAYKYLIGVGADDMHADIMKFAARVRDEAIAPYKEAIASHEAKMAKVPALDEQPKTAAQGLRFLARWFDAMYPDDGDTQVQDDLRKWANEWENVRVEARREAMEEVCRAVCLNCAKGIEVVFADDDRNAEWVHKIQHSTLGVFYSGCDADSIRAAFAKPAEAGDNIEGATP